MNILKIIAATIFVIVGTILYQIGFEPSGIWLIVFGAIMLNKQD